MGLSHRLARVGRLVGRGLRWVARPVWRLLRAVGRGLRRVTAPLWRLLRRVARPVVAVLVPVGQWFSRALRNADGTPAPPKRATFVVVGAVAVLMAGVTVVAATRSSPPVPPMLPVGPVATVGTAVFDEDRDVLFLAVPDDRVRAFAPPSGTALTWCEDSGQIEADEGRAWGPDGRSLDGGPSLVVHPTRVHDGVLYLDVTRGDPLPPGEDTDPTLACAD